MNNLFNAAAAILLGVLLAAAAIEKNKPPAPKPDPTPSTAPAPNAILTEVNRVRADHKLSPFQASECLTKQAADWAAEMQKRGRISHSGFDARLSACNMQGGEIVAWGQRSPAEVVEDWMNSPGHRARILSKSTHFGGGSAGVYWCGIDGTPAQAAVSVGSPPDESIGDSMPPMRQSTKCKCSGQVDCVCSPVCNCEKGNECKSAYKSIVATCNAAAAGDCSCEKCECLGPKQCKAGYQPSIDVAVVCSACKGTGKAVCLGCNGTGTVSPKFAEPESTKYTEPQPAKAADEYMQVRVPYTVSAGWRGRRSYVEYRTEWMLKSEYQRRLSAQSQPRTYYRGGCANGQCR